MARILLFLLAFGLTISLAAPASASLSKDPHLKIPGREKHILVLHSYHSGLPWTDQIMAGMQEGLAVAGHKIHFHVEYLDTKRHSDVEYFSHILDAILHYKLAARSFDLVLLSDNEALNFVLEHREDMFKETPVVFCGINRFNPESLDEYRGITGVVETIDYRDLINTARTLFPETEEIVVIGSQNEYCSRLNQMEFSRALEPFDHELQITYWNDLPATELETRLSGLPPGRIVLINGPVLDDEGNVLSFEDKCHLIRNASPAPLFSPWDIYLDHGIVGGSLLSAKFQGLKAAEMTLEILAGKKPDSIPVHYPEATLPVFDYLELKKFHISDRDIPFDYQLINEPPAFYKLSKRQAWASAGVLSGSLFISLTLLTNILKRKRAEASLRDSEQSYRQLSQQFQIILDGIPDGLTLISPDMKVVWSNKGAGNYFNKTLGSVPGEYCCKMLYNRNAICENCPAIEAFRSGRSEEAIITTPDGRVLEVKAFPLKAGNDEITHIILLASDITEKSKLREEAIRASRLASLGELAAGVAHEINNPNALILLNSDLVRKACHDAAPILRQYYEQYGEFSLGGLPFSEMCSELPHLFQEMEEGAQRIKRIVEDLKDFTRVEGPDLDEMVDLNEVVQASIRLIGSTIRKSTSRFEAVYGENLPFFRGSMQRIEQVVINLLVNACQALPDRDRGIFVKTWFDAETELIKLRIKDEGCGISPENLPHISDPFFTTKRKQGGTGLGLSVSMRIVRDHHGEVDFISLPDQGTTVVLTLPACQEVSQNDEGEGTFLPLVAYSAG